jgi:hypothetical protein
VLVLLAAAARTGIVARRLLAGHPWSSRFIPVVDCSHPLAARPPPACTLPGYSGRPIDNRLIYARSETATAKLSFQAVYGSVLRLTTTTIMAQRGGCRLHPAWERHESSLESRQ